MQEAPGQTTTLRRLAIAARGVVQGVGFRPFVYNLARSRGLTGWVQNEADQVRIEVQGPAAELDAFCEALRLRHPPQARVDALEIRETAGRDDQTGGFEIRSSEGHASPQPTIPADLATCAECLDEIRTPTQRRHRYPFTNCTNCGPRWSIIEQLPYDRPRTSMARFVMCPDCEAEYRNPADRRFHAQPIACPACGPTLQLLDQNGHEIAYGPAALDKAVDAVQAGGVLALKGLGGFQLVVDATKEEAVSLLRRRKRRPDRPLALMLASLDEARRRCEVSDEEAFVLASHQAPILLLRRRTDPAAAADLARSVAPGNPYLGVMLPYTPLHHLLMEAVGRPIVCTSGNLSEEPMAITTEDALERLGSIADVLLVHDRPIVRPVDDSVARITPDGLQIHRRARGFAPLPVDLGAAGPVVLAVGGHLKNTVGLALGRQAVLSPHIGDLESVLSVEVHRRAVRDLVEFFQVRPAAVACDLHPDYASTRHAELLAAEWAVPLVRVQHHHAHVAAAMAEHGLEGPVLGLSWDGTGYGSDGTVWGGEFLQCQGAEFRRVAHLRTFMLPGGDRAMREPRRSALGLLFEIFGEDARRWAATWFAPDELNTLLGILKRGFNCPRTSSMGRLFDAVAALCGLPPVITFEGHAAMALEFAAGAERVRAEGVGSLFPCRPEVSPTDSRSSDTEKDSRPLVADWEPMLRSILADRQSGVPISRISARFHAALAELAVAVARRWGGRQVVLSGGCFQNALLAGLVRRRLLEGSFEVYTHRQVPPGDGGIALGQLSIAARRMER
ncbi:MAG: carbamoyltransferase HypF [Pirellulales bacterium]|nr:carbamoyltransferase HypF [Pirellulales bacterium]